MKTANISVSFLDMKQISSYWTLTDVNLIMSRSDLRGGIFTLHMTGGEATGYIKINNSTWGHLNVSNSFDIKISECNFTDATTYIPLLDVSFCNVTIQNSILDNEKFSVLRGVSSHIKIINTTFISSSTTDQLVIHLKKCNLSMKNCSVKHGCGSLIYAKESSVVNISNCEFDCREVISRVVQRQIFQEIPYLPFENRVEYLSSIGLSSYIFIIVRSRVTLSSCIFNKFNSVFFAQNHSEIRAFGSRFEDGDTVMMAVNNGLGYFYKSSFERSGSMFNIVKNSTIDINHSNITLNTKEDPLILMSDNARVYLRNSLMGNNFCESSFVYAQSYIYFNMLNCTYTNNTLNKESTHFLFFDNTDVSVQNSTFLNNTRTKALFQIISGSIHLERTFFEKNSLGRILNGKKAYIKVDNCTIKHDNKFENPVIFLMDATLNVNNSTFHSDTTISVQVELMSNNYINVVNSLFNQTSLYAIWLTDVNVDGSRFEEAVLGLLNTANTRISKSEFLKKSDNLIELSFGMVTAPYGESFQLKTFDIVLSWTNITLISNMTNFMMQGKKEGLISVEDLAWVKHTETAYASRKYNLAIYFSEYQLYANGLVSKMSRWLL